MELYFFIIIFIFGLVVGSFLNVVIYWLESTREKEDVEAVILACPESQPHLSKNNKIDSGQAGMTKGRANLLGRSFCPHCNHKLGFLDLVPLFSWIFLKGQCRYCKEKISVQYPLVELGTGIIFALTFYFFDFNLELLTFPSVYGLLAAALLIIINSLLIMIFVYDLKHKIIPNKIIYPAIILATGYLLLATVNPGGFSLNSILITTIASAIGAGGFFYAIAAFSGGKWMGGGDIKLAFLMGLLLGWPNILVGLFLGFFLGALVGIFQMILNKADFKSEIPFGPFLIAGTWIALFYGDVVVKYYLSTLGV